jgi:hypothetical protein
MLDHLREDDTFDGSNIFCNVGPTTNIKSYFTFMLVKREPPFDELSQGLDKLLDMVIDLALCECQSEIEEETKFVLSHPDLDIQNVIVSEEDGSLRGLIDWDGVITVPRCLLGNERYLSWLTRDWDGMKYRYRENTPSGPDNPNNYENSPSELISYREMYQEIIETLSRSHSAKRITSNSLILENLTIAANDPICAPSIVERIFEEVKAKTAWAESSILNNVDRHMTGESKSERLDESADDAEEEEDDDEEEDYSFYLYEVATALSRGELGEDQQQRLIRGFKALLS